MRRLIVLLALTALMLTACFRDAGNDTPTALPVGLGNQPVAQVSSPTPDATEDLAVTADVTEAATEEATDVALEPSLTPTAPASATATPSVTPTPAEVAMVDEETMLREQYEAALAQGGQEAVPMGEPTDAVDVAVQLTATPSDTPTSTPTDTPTPTHTSTPTDTPTVTLTPSDTPDFQETVDVAVAATLTAQPTDTPTHTPSPTNTLPATLQVPTHTGTPLAARPTWTTVPLQPFDQLTMGQGGPQNPNQPATTGDDEVAQVVTPTPETGANTTAPQTQGLTISQMTATAVIQAATATQAAQETIAAGGDPNAPAVVATQPGAQGGQNTQTQPQANVTVVTNTPVGAIQDCNYLIGIGDNLSSIARRYNLTTDELAQANGILNPDLIEAGDVLVIPGCGQLPRTPTPTAAAAQTGGTPNPNVIDPNRGEGRQLDGPGSGGSTDPLGQGGGVNPNATDNSQGPFVYTIQPGDRIYQLSLIYGVTMREILSANPQITNMNLIYEGQEIIIPGPPTQTTQPATTNTQTQPQGVVITATPDPAAGQTQPQTQPTVQQPTQPASVPFTPTPPTTGTGNQS